MELQKSQYLEETSDTRINAMTAKSIPVCLTRKALPELLDKNMPLTRKAPAITILPDVIERD